MNPRPTRRRFLKAIAAGTTALAGAPLAEGAGQRDETGDATPAHHLAEVVRLRHGARLAEAQLQVIQREIADAQRIAEAVKRVRLDPADEPATVFLPDVPE